MVEVFEDSLPSLHLLILVELCLCWCLASCDTFKRLCTRSEQLRPSSAIFFTFPRELWCLESSFCRRFDKFLKRPCSHRHSRHWLQMWNVRSCWFSCYSWHSIGALRGCRQYPRCRGSFPTAPRSLHSRSNGLTAPLHALSPGAAWRNALLHAEQGWRTPGPGFRGRLLRVMHNSWPLWTFQLRPLSLMGNPNGDLFIKTISWLFVVLASHKGATSHPNIITSFRGTSRPLITLTRCTRLSDHWSNEAFVWALVHEPQSSVPLSLFFFISSSPISLPFPPPLSWVHPHAVTLNLNI